MAVASIKNEIKCNLTWCTITKRYDKSGLKVLYCSFFSNKKCSLLTSHNFCNAVILSIKSCHICIPSKIHICHDNRTVQNHVLQKSDKFPPLLGGLSKNQLQVAKEIILSIQLQETATIITSIPSYHCKATKLPKASNHTPNLQFLPGTIHCNSTLPPGTAISHCCQMIWMKNEKWKLNIQKGL